MSSPRRVLFLCTGNSCRSQMAESLVNSRHVGWQAVSAGVRPAGGVHPMAVQVLREIGIEHHGESKSVESFWENEFDLVVTLCDEAKEECPAWLGKGRRLHAGFVDPAKAGGSEEERLDVFRQLRDQIALKIPELLGA